MTPVTGRSLHMRRHARSVGACVVLAVGIGACGDGNLVTAPASVASLQVVDLNGAPPPAQLPVAGHSDVVVVTRDDHGSVLTGRAIAWSSSDSSVISIAFATGGSQELLAVARGTAIITAKSEGVSVSLPLTVTAAGLVLIDTNPVLAIGESRQLTGGLVDALGRLLVDQAGVTWHSSDPAVATVTATGVVTGIGAGSGGTPPGDGHAAISLTSNALVATTSVVVKPIVSGLPASLRLVHAASGLGVLTFRPSTGGPVSLAFGESADIAVTSGHVTVAVDGFPPVVVGQLGIHRFDDFLAPGTSVTLYAVGFPPDLQSAPVHQGAGTLVTGWGAHGPIASGHALVRVVMGGGMDYSSYAYSNLYLLGAGAPVSGLPYVCYFDMGGYTDFISRTTGPFDIVMAQLVGAATPTPEFARFRVTPQPDRATTYVITGLDSASMRVMTIVDP